MSSDQPREAIVGPSTAVRIARQVAWVALVLVALVLFIVTGGYDAMGSIQSRLAHQVMAYLVLGSWLLVALVRPAWRPRTPLLPAIALAVVAYGLSTLASQRPRLSLEPGLAGPALAMTYLFLATLLTDSWFRRRLTVLLIMVVSLTAIAYLLAVGFEWTVFYRLVRQITLPPLRPSWTDLRFGSPNLVATFLLVLGPLAVVLLHEMSRRLWPPLLLAFLSAVGVFLTGSRGAFLGAAVGMLALAALLVARIGWRATLRQVIAALRRRPILIFPSAVACVGVVVLMPSVLYRFAQGGERLRLDLWQTAWTIFQEHPILGSGPGTWVQLKIAVNPPGVHNLIVAHAHSLYIQALAELGVVGLAALALLSVVVLRRLVGAAIRTPHGTHSIAALVGLAAFMGQSLVDNLVNLPYICVMVMTVVAWVDAALIQSVTDPLAGGTRDAPRMPSDAALPQTRRWLWSLRELASGRLLVASLLATLVAAVPTLVRIDRAAAAQMTGDAVVMKDPARGLAAYEEALRLDPEFTLYQIQRAVTLARLGKTGEARAQLAEAVRADETGINLIGLASLDIAVGDLAAARRHIHQGLERTGDELAVVLNAALMSEVLGDREQAKNLLAVTLLARPAAAALPLLDDPARMVPKAEVIGRAREWADPLVAALILAYAGDPTTARRELMAMPPSTSRDVYAAAARWLGGEAIGAVQDLQEMLRKDPLNYEAAAWLSGILRAEGDPSAGTYFRLARLVQGDVGPSIARDVTATVVRSDVTGSGVPGHYPWAVYVRAYSGNVLVPGLLIIGAP